MSVAKKTEMYVCVYVCGIEKALVKPLGPLQSSYRQGLPHTYTHMHISVFFFLQIWRDASLKQGLHEAPAKLLQRGAS